MTTVNQAHKAIGREARKTRAERVAEEAFDNEVLTRARVKKLETALKDMEVRLNAAETVPPTLRERLRWLILGR